MAVRPGRVSKAGTVMLRLLGRADASGLAGPMADDVWRICLPDEADSERSRADGEVPGPSIACLLRDEKAAPPGYGLYLIANHAPGMRPGTPRITEARGPEISRRPGPVLRLGPELAHLDTGDIIHVPGDGRRVTVLWKNSARHNALLLTEQCDNYCLMCSQPPKDRDDAWLFDRAKKVISLLPPGTQALSLTGGEPTLRVDALIDLLEHCQRVAPGLSVHLLTNGRRFADSEFTRRYAAVGISDIMAGIPVYAPEPGLHDFIVQATGAFDENSARHPQPGLTRPAGGDPGGSPAAHGPGPRRPGGIHRSEPAVRRPGRADGTGNDRPGPAERAASVGRPRRLPARAGQSGRHTRDSGDHDADLQPSALRPGPAPVADTRSAQSVTGRTTTWTSAAPARSATHAAASSRQAATASASTWPPYPDQPMERDARTGNAGARRM